VTFACLTYVLFEALTLTSRDWFARAPADVPHTQHTHTHTHTHIHTHCLSLTHTLTHSLTHTTHIQVLQVHLEHAMLEIEDHLHSLERRLIDEHFHSLERKLVQSIQEQLETKLTPHLHDLCRQQPSMYPNAHTQDHLQVSIYLFIYISASLPLLSLSNAKMFSGYFERRQLNNQLLCN